MKDKTEFKIRPNNLHNITSCLRVKATIAASLYGLTRIAQAENDLGQAQQLGERSLAIFKDIGYKGAVEVEAWLTQFARELWGVSEWDG